jgi:putative Mg2+ transporter-C (MgtC) family protein
VDWEPLLRVTIAAALVLPLGLDRELRGKAAGLRTHVLVATASAALGFVSVLAAPTGDAGTDSTRIASQVVTGIGFMGAGVIFAARGRVHGLTTAASLWSAMAIGLVAGLGEMPLAVALALVTFLALWPLNAIADRLIGRWALQERVIHVVVDDVHVIADLQKVLDDLGTPEREIEVESLGQHVAVRMIVRCREDMLGRIAERFSAIPSVSFFTDRGAREHVD